MFMFCFSCLCIEFFVFGLFISLLLVLFVFVEIEEVVFVLFSQLVSVCQDFVEFDYIDFVMLVSVGLCLGFSVLDILVSISSISGEEVCWCNNFSVQVVVICSFGISFIGILGDGGIGFLVCGFSGYVLVM